jgi:hypothetical protein
MSEHDAERLAWRAYHASYALFRQNGVPEADCEDLAHEVVYRLLCHLQEGNPVCDRWIGTVARHVLIDYHRKGKQEREALMRFAQECAGGGTKRHGTACFPCARYWRSCLKTSAPCSLRMSRKTRSISKPSPPRRACRWEQCTSGLSVCWHA